MENLRNAGFPRMDRLHRNLEGELISRDREANSYVAPGLVSGAGM